MSDLARSAGGGSATVAGRPPPGRDLAPTGLSEAEAERRLAAARRPRRAGTSRSYASIVRANVLTVFNLILAGFGAVTLIFGDARDALFLGDHRRELRDRDHPGGAGQAGARPALAAGRATRDREARRADRTRRRVEQVVVDDLVVIVQPGDQLIADGTVLSPPTDLRLDESILTGESEPVGRVVGDEVRSGAFVVGGTGAYGSPRSVSDSFAARVTGRRARSAIRGRRSSGRSTGCSTRWSGSSSGSAPCSAIRSTIATCPFTRRWPPPPPGW